jgi:NAD(P)-dependent dehydrogenase (short-subunit alcohol dehydrogenase family)
MNVTSILDTALDRSLLGYGNVGYFLRKPTWTGDLPSLQGKRILVTGAKRGLGKATVTGLARLGATVHMAVRGHEEGERAKAEILREVPGADIVVDELDVSLLGHVRAFAQRWDGPLYGLLHNAGTMPGERTETSEGNETMLATHVLGPHLLTKLLRPALAEDAPSRVFWVSSLGMYSQKLDVDDLQYRGGSYRPLIGYARTKRMQVVLAHEWAQQLAADRIMVHGIHPGWVDTPGSSQWLPKLKTVTRPLIRNAQQGADTFVWAFAAEEPGRVSGRFWHDRRERPEHYIRLTHESEPDRLDLWNQVEELTASATPAVVRSAG